MGGIWVTLRRGWDRRAIVIGSGRDLPPRGKICPRRCRTRALAGVCTSDEILDCSSDHQSALAKEGVLQPRNKGLPALDHCAQYPGQGLRGLGPAYRNYITKEEEIAIYEEIASSESAKNELEYNEKITEKIRYYLDRVDSKKQELLEIAQANAAEKERLAKEAEERAKREAEEKRQELLNFTQKQQTSIEAEKTEASLNTLFDQNYSAPAANVKKTLSIEVSNPAGYGQIFMFWFEREGKNLTNEKIEKKSISQMKKFCEDIANKDGEIISSNFITYKEVITAK